MHVEAMGERGRYHEHTTVVTLANVTHRWMLTLIREGLRKNRVLAQSQSIFPKREHGHVRQTRGL